MPSVDPRAAEMIKTIEEFEASVAAAETALVSRDWPTIDALLSEQHRLTHALANALDATRDERPEAFSEQINRRLRAISARRADQLSRLIAFNYSVKQRLTMISRSREKRWVNDRYLPPPRILDARQ